MLFPSPTKARDQRSLSFGVSPFSSMLLNCKPTMQTSPLKKSAAKREEQSSLEQQQESEDDIFERAAGAEEEGEDQ